MKKKLVSILIVSTMVASLLAGCGSKASKTSKTSAGAETITVSKMLKSVLDDNDGKVFIYTESARKDSTSTEDIIGKDFEASPYLYTGDSLLRHDNLSMGEVIQGAEMYPQKHKLSVSNFAVATDSTGNNVAIEGLTCLDEDEKSKAKVSLYFGAFSRTQIYDKSYMVFKSSNRDYICYVLIEDTDSTKDKTVVFDALDMPDLVIDDKNIRFRSVSYTI